MIVWPGLRRSVSAIRRLFNSASFYAPLTHSAIPTRAASGTTATFTRATAKTWPNNDGYQVTGLAGEIGFPGARRVRNNFTFSEDNTNAAYTQATVTTTTTTIVYGAAKPTQFYRHVTGSGASAVAVGSAWAAQVKVSGTPGNKINFYIMNGAATRGSAVQITLSATPTVYTLAYTATNAEALYVWLMPDDYLGLTVGTLSQTVTATQWQCEDVTAQTTQTAGEYVSVGVESAPYYHGSFADGVKCFPNDLSGNPIPSTTLLGYSAEGARTNLWTYSQAFDNAAWTKSTITVAANDAVAPDGTTTADKLTNDDTASGLARTATVTANTTYTDSIHLKYGNNAWARILYGTGADAVQLWVNIQTGTIGTVTASGGTAVLSAYSIESVNGGFWRIQAAVNLGGAITVFQRRSYLVNADNSGTIVAAAYAHHWGAQLELGSFASSYIATTTIAVARNADVLTYPSAGNIDGTKGWCYAEFTQPVDGSNPAAIVSIDNGGTQWQYAYLLGTGIDLTNPVRFQGYNGSVQWQQDTAYNNAASKIAWSYATNAVSMAKDGTVVGTDTSAALPSASHISIGHLGGNLILFGNIKNVRLGQRQLSASELQAITQ